MEGLAAGVVAPALEEASVAALVAPTVQGRQEEEDTNGIAALKSSARKFASFHTYLYCSKPIAFSLELAGGDTKQVLQLVHCQVTRLCTC